MKQYDITVSIRVSVPEGVCLTPDEWAKFIAEEYAGMAVRYKSISADEILQIDIKKV